MKKRVLAVLAFVMLLLLTSCEKGVTYLHLPSETDKDIFEEIIDVDAGGTDEVVFQTYEVLSNVSVNIMDYDYETDVYTVKSVVFEKNNLKIKQALKLKLNFLSDVPYVMIKYTRQNGETREQYVYQNQQDGRLWLLERE